MSQNNNAKRRVAVLPHPDYEPTQEELEEDILGDI